MDGGLVARPGMALLPCHQWPRGCCRPVGRHALTADRDTAITPAPSASTGEKLFDKPRPQDEATLRDLFTGLQDRGKVLMVERGCCGSLGPIPGAIPRR